jgi:hypothetical protein
MHGFKKLAIFYGLTAAVILSLPVAVALVDRLTGGAFGRLYDSTIGAVTAAAQAPAAPGGATTSMVSASGVDLGLTAGASGAALVRPL